MKGLEVVVKNQEQLVLKLAHVTEQVGGLIQCMFE